jgi:cation diffusion facilitator CzcD-associated flavoprotein CzcO
VEAQQVSVNCPSEACAPVTVLGGSDTAEAAASALVAAGVIDFTVLRQALLRSVFDDTADTWTLHIAAGGALRSSIVVATQRTPFVPWTPEFLGRNDFRGESFHAARWDPDFDAAGKRVAVVGADASAGHYLGRLAESAASVTVFAHAPRRIVDELPTAAARATHWLALRARVAASRGPTRPALVRSAISRITSTGVRTADGADHCADAIIYGTGFTVVEPIAGDTLVGANGVTLRQAWIDGMEPYYGVAVHGFPNHFFLTGPDVAEQARYVAECVRLVADTAATRIEVRRSTQQVFNERACLRPARPRRAGSAFDVSFQGGESRAAYDGAATLTIAGTRHPVRVRLAGHLDPKDGHYHWQGTVFASPSRPLPDEALRQSRTATLTIGERSAPARIVEKTPWGTHSVAGVGVPPYAPS